MVVDAMFLTRPDIHGRATRVELSQRVLEQYCHAPALVQREDSGVFDCTLPRMSHCFPPPRSDAYQSGVKTRRVSRGKGRIRSTSAGQIEGRADQTLHTGLCVMANWE
ncbi:hypothetical protein HBI53_133010 [Parastagonospora nodorum]|nr:hypothetical protein HBI53_133010 [Parastagonospora nodorum]